MNGLRRGMGFFLLCAMVAGPAGAQAPAGSGHEHHSGDGREVPALQLDGGKKWQTDEALRQGMVALRDDLRGALPAIHRGELSPEGYVALAGKLERGIQGIFASCKLPPRADAQLHIVLGELLAGVEAMRGTGDRHAGAVRFLGGLDHYGAYFDHPGWEPAAR